MGEEDSLAKLEKEMRAYTLAAIDADESAHTPPDRFISHEWASRLSRLRKRLMEEADEILDYTGGVANESIEHDDMLRAIAGEE